MTRIFGIILLLTLWLQSVINVLFWQVAGPWTEKSWNSSRPLAKGSLGVRSKFKQDIFIFHFHFSHQAKVTLENVVKLCPLCVLVRCDGRRLQRDQGGGQVHQKWRYSTGFHRWGFCHDVRSAAIASCTSHHHRCFCLQTCFFIKY